jgi:thiosulfate/3-mercaptopyruvate sulfurtransferase
MHRFKTLISADELQSCIDQPDWRVVDCRFNLLQPAAGRQQYADGHLRGAVYADLDKDLAAPIRADSGRHPLPDPELLAAKLGRWGISNHSQVIVYDQTSGAIASRLWWLLRWLGHRDVAVLDGGIAAWLGSGGVLQRGTVSPVECEFKANPDEALILGTTELVGNLDSIRLVDARDRERFLGRKEPIDRVAGHIPGALNLPFSECQTEDGRMLSPHALRQRWQTALGSASQGAWAVMCGSGVTACHLALSAEIAGLAAPRLYVGSWSEWIRDPGRPVATEGP